MASFFKASCMIYWVIWFFCSSYTLGVWVFRQRYPVEIHSVEVTFKIMVALTFFNCSMCFIGCIWLKCDITHIACALCFIVPVVLVNFTLSIYGLIELRAQSNYTEIETYKEFDTLMKKHDAPIWLLLAQNRTDCCGVYSYLDYKKYPDYYDASKNELKVPCCKKHGNTPTFCSVNFNGTSSKVPIISIYSSTCNKTAAKYWNPGKQTSHEVVKDSKLSAINTCGCHHILTSHVHAVATAKFVFFLLTMFCSFCMVGMYVRNWCRDRQGVNAGSDHSLDIDELLIPTANEKMGNKISFFNDEEEDDDGSSTNTTAVAHVQVHGSHNEHHSSAAPAAHNPPNIAAQLNKHNMRENPVIKPSVMAMHAPGPGKHGF